MKLRQLSLAALVALTVAAPTHAQESLFYYGFKAGLMDAKASGHDNPLNLGGLVGMQIFDQPQGTGSIEGEITTTLVDGDRDAGGDWDMTTVAAYFAFRTMGDVYGKGKVGFASQDVGGTTDVPEGSVFSAGIGVGWHANKQTGLELEYTLFDDVKFLTLGFFSHF